MEARLKISMKGLRDGEIGNIIAMDDTHVTIEYPQNFVYEGTGPDFRERRDYPRWNSTPFANKAVMLPYCSFVCIGIDKVEIIK